jgi:DNA-binding CsgD family transcriptional regulator
LESLSTASIAENMAGDHAAARRLLDEAEAISGRVDHYPAAIALIQARATHALAEGDLATVQTAARAGARLSREVSDPYYLEQMLLNLGLAELAGGDLRGARARFIEGLRVASKMDDRLGQATFLGLLSGQAAESGKARLAARLLGASESLGSAAGAGTAPIGRESVRARDAGIAALGEAKFEVEYAAGRRLSQKAALQLAIGEPDSVAVDADEQVEAGPLSKRETEVARLIAEGMSNKQIGARLFISERTVTTHVGNILNKLGFDSRVQIASWMSTSD